MAIQVKGGMIGVSTGDEEDGTIYPGLIWIASDSIVLIYPKSVWNRKDLLWSEVRGQRGNVEYKFTLAHSPDEVIEAIERAKNG